MLTGEEPPRPLAQRVAAMHVPRRVAAFLTAALHPYPHTAREDERRDPGRTMRPMAGRSKKHWSELSPGQRRAITAAGALQLGLMVAALADLRLRPTREIRGGKKLWTATAFVNFVGPIAYFAFGRRR